MDETLHSLKVLASVKPKEKLYTTNCAISIYSPMYFMGLRRYFTHQSRETNMKDVADIIQKGRGIVDGLLNQREEFGKPGLNESRDIVVARLENQQKIDNARAILSSVLNNIGVFKQTYDEDISINARIDLLATNTRDYLDRVTISLEYLEQKFC